MYAFFMFIYTVIVKITTIRSLFITTIKSNNNRKGVRYASMFFVISL